MKPHKFSPPRRPLSMLALPLALADASGLLRPLPRQRAAPKAASDPADKLRRAEAKRERRRQRNLSQLKG